MNLLPRRPIFNRRPENNVYRVFLYSILIIGGLWIFYGVGRGDIKEIGAPLPIPTRTALSYAAEGDAHFTSGALEAAISSYRRALELEPENAAVWATLARIQQSPERPNPLTTCQETPPRSCIRVKCSASILT